MMLRFAAGGCVPSASALFQPPAYHAHDTPLADSVSPIVFAVCGGSGCPEPLVPAGSAITKGPFGAGGMPLGWYGGCEVLSDHPSGETCPPPLLNNCTAPTVAEGEPGRFSSLPLASSRTRIDAGALSCRGAQAHTR